MIRKLKYLGGFLIMSMMMGFPFYLEIVGGELSRAMIMLGVWGVASFIMYAVYIGWLKTGAAVVMQERYSTGINLAPLTRDEEIFHQYVLFLNNIHSIVRDTNNE